MTQHLSHVVDSLERIAQLLLLAGENEFRARAYDQAARLVEAQAADFEGFLQRLRQGGVAGFGTQTAPLVLALAEGQPVALLEELEQTVPASVRELLDVPGLGPKKVRFLWKQAEISSVDALLRACEQQRIRECKGFGAKTEEKLLQLLPALIADRRRLRLDQAQALASDLSALLVANKLATCVHVSGELRRYCKEISELVLVAEQTSAGLDSLQLAKVCAPLAALHAHATLPSGQQSELLTARGFPIRVFWALTRAEAVQKTFETTGPEEFVARLRPKLPTSDRLDALQDEAQLFSLLEIPYVAPECRERGEEGTDLVQESDIRGILHCHSSWSDGSASLRQMALAARDHGWEYLGISDHSRSAAYANGLSVERVLAQQKEVQALNQELNPFVIFWGIESDILADGSLDYEPEILERFDFVIASVHSRFSLSREEMTQRILRALKNPYTTILGHPTGRLLLRRAPYELDLEEVIKVAGVQGKAIECNADPRRLDLDWSLHALARKQGVPVPLAPDAHSPEALDYLRYGLMQARKAGLRRQEVLNCKSAAELRAWFAQVRRAHFS